MKTERGKVWLGVSGLVLDEQGRWLVVKKKYGGLLGKWSLPAGFVAPGETADEAVKREILEETGVATHVKGMLGFRTGVLDSSISDNMVVFRCEPMNTTIIVQEEELEDAQWIDPNVLLHDKQASVMIHEMIKAGYSDSKALIDGINPGNQFGYTSYKLFF
ncbi:NUDIX domain-containing protein [Lederbergia citrea]|uniref:NUDIX domain-containing protein n=1 Tax=Lederbergia citrea TaxID=2833581 RepID=A0A942Z5G1_9BACI|nr:NUDIX domain-containing protein [Lederbergia citrea]MBS4205253.1 NUDIX domain-containing protein [Lederbergia citrea]MBS4222886.1 NUDIX domain-containing protein [Lederbergia citrea]